MKLWGWKVQHNSTSHHGVLGVLLKPEQAPGYLEDNVLSYYYRHICFLNVPWKKIEGSLKQVAFQAHSLSVVHFRHSLSVKE